MTLSILTCSPHFSDLAINELSRKHPSITILSEIIPGHILLHSPATFDNLTKPWRHRTPVYLHHMFPVQASVSLDGKHSDLSMLETIVRQQINTKMPVTIQPRIVVDTIPNTSQRLPYKVGGVVLAVKQALHYPVPSDRSIKKKILSILIVEAVPKWIAYLGASWANQNLSPWPGGKRPWDIRMPNRAGYKLLETLETFHIKLRAGDSALDLGAAPGAWTMVLRQNGLIVTSVSPDEMYQDLLSDPNVRHRQVRAEDYINRVEKTFDLITNDMKLDARDSARLMVEYANHLKSNGVGIMTLKLRQRNRRKIMDHTFRLLRKAYKIVRVRNLVSNRQEVTLFLRKKI